MGNPIGQSGTVEPHVLTYGRPLRIGIVILPPPPFVRNLPRPLQFARIFVDAYPLRPFIVTLSCVQRYAPPATACS